MTPTDVANSALVKLGVRPISDITDQSATAELVASRIDPVRQFCLRLDNWNFGKVFKNLQPDTETPDFGYSIVYPLPVDCIKLIAVLTGVTPPTSIVASAMSNFESDDDWSVVGKKVYSNQSSCSIVYITDVQDYTLFDSLFVEMMGVYLAMELCQPLLQSNEKVKELNSRFEKLQSKAKVTNARENGPRTMRAEGLLLSRLRNGSVEPTTFAVPYTSPISG